MKCDAAIIRESSVKYVPRSIVTVNHAGVPGSKNEMRQAGRPPTVVLPRTCASVTWTQPGTGCVNGLCGDMTHFLLVGERSQRRAPTTMPAQPPTTWYATRSGAWTRHALRAECVGPD